MTRDDWPLGIALKSAREKAGLSVRAAARRTKGAISSGRWYQLESGYQKAGGHAIPIGTTAATVAAAAKAIDWDIDEALKTAGFDSRDYIPPLESELSKYTDEELLDEIRERMKGARSGVDGETKPDAPAQGGQAQEDGLNGAEEPTYRFRADDGSAAQGGAD